MTGAQYIEHFKVLGKLCRLWDDASADSSATKELISRAYKDSVYVVTTIV